MKGLLINVTGDGKGKTTSALGTAIRAVGQGMTVAIFQFIKSDKNTGEYKFLSGISDKVTVKQVGIGFTWNNPLMRNIQSACDGWNEVKPYLTGDKQCDLLILDELNVVMHLGFLSNAEVISNLKCRKPELHVMITGRYAPESLIAISDLVSRIDKVKHPFDHGIDACKGIDF